MGKGKGKINGQGSEGKVKCIQGKRKGRERERIHKDVCT